MGAMVTSLARKPSQSWDGSGRTDEISRLIIRNPGGNRKGKFTGMARESVGFRRIAPTGEWLGNDNAQWVRPNHIRVS